MLRGRSEPVRACTHWHGANAICCGVTEQGAGMSEEIKETHQLGISERSLDWRIVTSAWLVDRV